MLRRLYRFCVFLIYVACSLGLLGALIQSFTKSPHLINLGLIFIESIGFIVGLGELYLLKRNRNQSNVSNEDVQTHVYVFIGDESLETARISLLSLKYLRGSPKVTVLTLENRLDIESLCSEFGFDYSSENFEFDKESDHYLFTNGYTIIYPDAILVGERRMGDSISYVELNHNIYSSHALGNNNVGNDASRVSLISSAAGSFSVPIYTGGPILVQKNACDFSELEQDKESIPTFSEVIAAAASSGHRGTITSHPCCECMSHNEIDHNISSRTDRMKVSRKLRHHPQYVDTASGIIRRYVGWYYMRFFWLRSIAYLLVAATMIFAVFFPPPYSVLTFPVVSTFLLAQFSSFVFSYIQGDRRIPTERLRDGVLDCEAFLHAVSLKFRKNKVESRFRIRFVPFYICILLGLLIIEFLESGPVNSIDDVVFRTQFLTLAVISAVAITLYRAMYRYLSARQRAFARRSVSITGSSSYESMWIVDLTHRGAAYISDSKLDLGEETPLVFRIPTMTGDSLITVVGKVTYCAPRGSKYQVGVAFKELSLEALDDLTLYCSVLYPYRQARNIEDTENLASSEDILLSSNSEPGQNRLSFSFYGLIVVILVGMLATLIPVKESGSSSKYRVPSFMADQTVEKSYSAFGDQYLFSSLATNSDKSSDVVTLSSTIFFDSDNDGQKGNGENGISGVEVRLFSAKNVEIPVGPDGVLGNGDDGSGPVITNDSGEYSFRYINSGSYYVQLKNVDNKFQLSDESQKKSRAVQTSSADSKLAFNSAIFKVDSKYNGNIAELKLGFVEKFDLEAKIEILDVPSTGFVPGDRIRVRVQASNAGPSQAKSGFEITSILGSDFSQDDIDMTQISGFSPCGFSGSKLSCISTTALEPGESKSVEFSVVSRVSSTSSSSRRMISAAVAASQLDRSESDSNSPTANNTSEAIVPVGKSTSIGDRVFFDANSNGKADSGERGVEGVRVGLLQFKDVNGDGVMDPGETPEIANDVTDSRGYFGVSNGKSGFENLTPGAQYSLVFSDLPKGTSASQPNVSSSENDSDADPSTLSTPWKTIDAGVVDTTLDLGIVRTSVNFSKTIYVDSNNNGKFDKREKPLIVNGVRLLKWVDINSNNKQDPGEIADSPIAFASISEEGLVEFVDISIDVKKTYFAIEFDVPDGYSVSKTSKGKVDKKYPQRIQTEFIDFKKFAKVDVGLLQESSSISGKFWIDFNRNAIKDANEYGIGNLQVELVSSMGKSSKPTFTDKDGNYIFNSVGPGVYFVGISDSSIPNGFIVPGFNNQKIADSIAGRTDISISIDVNTPTVVRDLPLVASSGVSGTVYVGNSQEKIFANRGVTLKSGENPIAVTHTDSKGTFKFTRFIPGDYRIELENQKASNSEIALVPGDSVYKKLENENQDPSFMSAIEKGNFSSAEFEKLQNEKIFKFMALSAIFLAGTVVLILFKRRKLVYRSY